MNDKRVVIYGGSSYVSEELIKILSKDYSKFTIICRNKNYIEDYISKNNLQNLEIDIFEADLLDLEKNLSIIENFETNIVGLIWVAGFAGNPDEEFNDIKKCKENLTVNFVNPVLLINKIIPKIIPNDDSFIAVLTSVAGIRGRGKKLFYSSAKSGMNAYLSGLRQKIFDKKINVLTVIPGYMNTKPFNIKAPKFLICSPEKAAKIIYKSIIKKKEIVYINFFWRIIMMIINFIPEKIYKKLKF